VNNMVILLVAVLAIVALVALAAWAMQRRRSDQLRRRFGPEYERTVGSARDKRQAEAELRARQERVDALEIRPLDRASRDRYVDRWREVQAMFVDDPGNAVDQADKLIGEVMRARGYPVGDFEQRAADVSVNHPHVVDHYRTAHGIAVRRRTGDGATEELRQAFVHYRALFADLLEVSDSNSAKAAAEAPAAAEPPDGTSHGATAEDAPTEAATAAPRTPAPDTTTTAEADTPAETRRTR
jgi:hypothetical protein